MHSAATTLATGNCFNTKKCMQFDLLYFRVGYKGVPFYVTKTYGGRGCIAPFILNLGSRRSKWSLHVPAALLPVQHAGAHWTGGRVGPSVGLDVSEKRKIAPIENRNPNRPVRSLVRVRRFPSPV
jgi:hypothetical protein